MTPAESRAAAVVAVRAQLGLTNTPPSNWSYETRVEYNKALADYIQTNASSFTAQDQYTANQVASANYSPLAGTSIADDLNTFGDEFADQLLAAGAKVGNVGTGVLNSVSLIGTLLPVIAFAAAAITLYSFYKTRPGIK